MKIVGGKKMSDEQKDHEVMQKEIDELKKQLEEKDLKIEDQKNQILRLMADFDNFKKRAAMERDEIICFSNEAMVMGLIPILDNFDRAMAHVESKGEDAKNDEVIKGFALIKKQFEDLLAKTGLSKIDCVSKQFDPFYHEAILTKESDKPEGEILEEVQKGYSLKEKVIRPSMVIVCKKGEK